MKIVSVRDKRVKALIENPDLTNVKGFTAIEVRKVAEMVIAIRVAGEPQQLAAVPSWRVHELTGARKGTWSLRVTGNYRLTFIYNAEDGTARLLDYEDYH